MRLRHQTHQGPARHLKPPYATGTERRRGGRVHHRDLGGGLGRVDDEERMEEGLKRADRPSRRRGGSVKRAGGGKADKEPTQGQPSPRQRVDQDFEDLRGPATTGTIEDAAKGGWIAGAIERPGRLHRITHTPQGEKIPAKKLAKAAKSSDPSVRRAVGLAKTLRKMKH